MTTQSISRWLTGKQVQACNKEGCTFLGYDGLGQRFCHAAPRLVDKDNPLTQDEKKSIPPECPNGLSARRTKPQL